VGKATIYRRWKNQGGAVHGGAADDRLALPDPDTGSLRGDVEAIIAFNLEHATRNGRAADAAPDGRGRRRSRPLRRDAARCSSSRAARCCGPILRRAVERGEMREDIDPEVAIDA
jgi:hypothetical protein